MRVLVLIALLALAGCGLTPAQRFGVVASVLVVGAIAAHQHDHGNGAGRALDDPALPCTPQPDGSCR